MEDKYKNYVSPSLNEKRPFNIELSEISARDINPRVDGLNEDNLKSLRNIEVVDFEPIILGRCDGEIVVIDGYHRTYIAKEKEATHIPAVLLDYADMDSMKIDAFKLNSNHGVRLSEKDQIKFLYPMFKVMLQKDSTLNRASFGRMVNISNSRNARRYINSALVMELLGKEVSEEREYTKYEFAYSYVHHMKCDVNSITPECKDGVNLLFEKYGHLPTKEFEKAVKCFIDGIEYFDTVKETITEETGVKKEESILDIIESSYVEDNENNLTVENYVPGTEVKVEEVPIPFTVQETTEEMTKHIDKVKEEIKQETKVELTNDEKLKLINNSIEDIRISLAILMEKIGETDLKGKFELEQPIADMFNETEEAYNEIMNRIQEEALI